MTRRATGEQRGAKRKRSVPASTLGFHGGAHRIALAEGLGPRWDFDAWRYWTSSSELAAEFGGLACRVMCKNIQVVELPREWRRAKWVVVVFFADCHFDLKYRGVLCRTRGAALHHAINYARQEIPGASVERWCGDDSWIARRGPKSIVIWVVSR